MVTGGRWHVEGSNMSNHFERYADSVVESAETATEWRGAAVGTSDDLMAVANVLDTLNDEQVPHSVPANELERLITAIDQQYAVEDLGYAGDSRIVNITDKVTGDYIMTATLTKTP